MFYMSFDGQIQRETSGKTSIIGTQLGRNSVGKAAAIKSVCWRKNGQSQPPSPGMSGVEERRNQLRPNSRPSR